MANIPSSPHQQETRELNKDAAPTLPLMPLHATWAEAPGWGAVPPPRSPPGSLRGVLASPASGQKSSRGLTAQQTAAKAEQNLNVAPLGREAKKEDKRGKAFCGRLVPAGVGEGGWLAEESQKVVLGPPRLPLNFGGLVTHPM